jgi:ankyrin repeat protein
MKHGASSIGEPIAAAIRERDMAKVRTLLDASPDLLHAGDGRSNQPIHWAVMTRQIDIIDDLLERGANINAARFDGARPIQLTNGDYTYRGWRDVPKDIETTPRQVLDYLRARGAYVDINTDPLAEPVARKALLTEGSHQSSTYVKRCACHASDF